VIGTIQYMAPEQARGMISEIDPRTDVFAMGAVLYKVLTGSCPYPGPFPEALRAAQHAEFRSPDETTGMAVKPPPHLSQIVMKAMAREPAQRYQSAEELAEALRAFLRGGNWFPLHKFAAGAVIVREGDRADAAYIITAGRCEVQKRDPNDPSKSHTLRVLQAGDVFGETAIFADAPRSATVIALEDVSAVVVERTALDTLVASSWLGQFVKALADRFLDVDARLSRATATREP
jgi:eukaryotic-like serine/threonine-protein kinase